jgi:hypothetical protein
MFFVSNPPFISVTGKYKSLILREGIKRNKDGRPYVRTYEIKIKNPVKQFVSQIKNWNFCLTGQAKT